jgi:uncharacterized DUF497 family protein
MAVILENCEGFEWDDGNSGKNWHLHRVTDGECEEIFFNEPLIVRSDGRRSSNEVRLFALGRTDSSRHLFIAFTIRGQLIRVISARDMNASEERKYAQKTKRDPGF